MKEEQHEELEQQRHSAEMSWKKQNESGEDSKAGVAMKYPSTGSVTTLKTLLSASKPKEEASAIRSADDDTKKPGVPGNLPTSKLTPVNEKTFGRVDSNRKLDKQIAQLIRKDEKLKMKAAKDEKLRRQTLDRGEKKRSDTLSSIHPGLSPASSSTDRDTITGYKQFTESSRAQTDNYSISSDNHSTSGHEKGRHRLFGRLGRMTKHSKKDDGKKSHTAPQLFRTDSQSSALSSASKKSNSSKFSGNSVGGLLGFRKK
ncbi:hypothetical protein JCM33374_g3802 [Metschnikowia sp. JCM 33374]|nr:hypothetical protein JCM33374_g3802 [Metschnikowia sp. JCM 33374]